MQELIEWLENGTETSVYVIRDKAKELLRKEKEQIVNTFDNGAYVGTYAVDKDGEEYYDEKYNQNK